MDSEVANLQHREEEKYCMNLQDRTDLMTPFHPRWEEFMARMNERLDCRINVETGEETWDCRSDPACPLATSILDAMSVTSSIDMEASLQNLAFHGGSCDCTIMMNVEASVQAQHEVDDVAFEDYQRREAEDTADQRLVITLRRSEVERLERLGKRLEEDGTAEMAAAFIIMRYLPECRLADENQETI
jgi:hypothetical protein